MDIKSVSGFTAILSNAANSFPREAQFHTAGHYFAAAAYVCALAPVRFKNRLGRSDYVIFCVVVPLKLTQSQTYTQDVQAHEWAETVTLVLPLSPVLWRVGVKADKGPFLCSKHTNKY